MSRPAQTRLARSRALFAALFLFVAAISAPTILATQTADACGMACCVKDGVCCCTPHRASVKGQVSDDKPRISEVNAKSCPEGCAPAGRFSNSLLRNHLHSGVTQTFCEQRLAFLEHIDTFRSLVQDGSFAPRAPPEYPTL